MCRYSSHCSCVWFLLWGLRCMPADLFARILPVPFLPAEIAGSARQACEILNQAGCDVNEDKACGQKIQLAYCSNAERTAICTSTEPAQIERKPLPNAKSPPWHGDLGYFGNKTCLSVYLLCLRAPVPPRS